MIENAQSTVVVVGGTTMKLEVGAVLLMASKSAERPESQHVWTQDLPTDLVDLYSSPLIQTAMIQSD